MTAVPPWRGPAPAQHQGVPSWSVPTSRHLLTHLHTEPPLAVSPEWAWDGATGAGVRVCVLDSGVDARHPLVAGLDRAVAVRSGPDGEPVVADCDPEDPVGHGTACAGIIRSLAPEARLTSVRVLSDGKCGSGAALLAGLAWAVDEGYDVINLSLSTAKRELRSALHELADRAYFRRCVLVVSAHNMPVLSYPWTFSSVISVASHDEHDPLAYYCNPAPPVDFLARGIRVRVAWTGGGFTTTTGNSFATPHISGLCARLLGKHPWLTPFQLKSVLYAAARNVAHAAEAEGGRHARQ